MHAFEVFEKELAEDCQWWTSATGQSIWNSILASPTFHPAPAGTDRATLRRRLDFFRLQRSFQASAKDKFPDPERWFWTRKLLEQSSDHWCATESAQDFPEGEFVADLCCGAGADAIALARRSKQVIACDCDPTALQLAALNAAMHDVNLTFVLDRAESIKLSRDSWIHIDPDRRAVGKRSTFQHAFAPEWKDVESMIDRCRGISIKVAPGTRYEGDRQPPVVRFLSRQRSVRQQRWLWNLNRWPQNSIVISAMSREVWHHEIFANAECEASEFHPASEFGLLGYIGDYDPAIRAGGVSNPFAKRLGCTILFENGYLTASEPVEHPLVRWFKVLECTTLDRKKLAAYSRSVGVRAWELKSRGFDIDLDALRKQLRTDPSSDRTLTLLCTRVEGKNRGIIAEEVRSRPVL